MVVWRSAPAFGQSIAVAPHEKPNRRDTAPSKDVKSSHFAKSRCLQRPSYVFGAVERVFTSFQKYNVSKAPYCAKVKFACMPTGLVLAWGACSLEWPYSALLVSTVNGFILQSNTILKKKKKHSHLTLGQAASAALSHCRHRHRPGRFKVQKVALHLG